MSVDKNLTSKVNYQGEITSTFWNQVALYISVLTSPPLTLIYALLISIPFLNSSSPWLWSLFFIVLFVVPPNLYVYYLLKKGEIANFHMDLRRERVKPLLFIILNTLLGISVFYSLGGPGFLIILSICCLLSIIAMFFVTLFWKISGHSVAAGGLCLIMIALFNEAAIPFTIIVPIIAWSRVKLSRHTVSQTLAGFILGIITFGLPLYLTGLI